MEDGLQQAKEAVERAKDPLTPPEARERCYDKANALAQIDQAETLRQIFWLMQQDRQRNPLGNPVTTQWPQAPAWGPTYGTAKPVNS